MNRGIRETVAVFGEKFEAPARANLCGSVRRWAETWGAITRLLAIVQRAYVWGRLQEDGRKNISFRLQALSGKQRNALISQQRFI